MRSMFLSLALAAGALGFTAATPAQARPDELVGPSVTTGNTMPVAAYWGGRGFYRGYYGGYRPYGGFYRGYYPGFYRPYGGVYRRNYYRGGLYPYGGFGGWGYPGFYW